MGDWRAGCSETVITWPLWHCVVYSLMPAVRPSHRLGYWNAKPRRLGSMGMWRPMLFGWQILSIKCVEGARRLSALSARWRFRSTLNRTGGSSPLRATIRSWQFGETVTLGGSTTQDLSIGCL